MGRPVSYHGAGDPTRSVSPPGKGVTHRGSYAPREATRGHRPRSARNGSQRSSFSPGGRSRLAEAERVLGDQRLVELVVALDDLEDLGVAQVALERVLVADTVRAVDLKGLGG